MIEAGTCDQRATVYPAGMQLAVFGRDQAARLESCVDLLSGVGPRITVYPAKALIWGYRTLGIIYARRSLSR